MAEKITFKCEDGVEVEADAKVMRYASGVLRDLLDSDEDIFGQSDSTTRIIVKYRQISRNTPVAEAESKFDDDMRKARVLEELGVAYDGERIRRLHEVAKYLDIKFLQELTETLIMRAPSREFMEMVSPWVDYNSLEAYRSHHVEACRNLEVAVQ